MSTGGWVQYAAAPAAWVTKRLTSWHIFYFMTNLRRNDKPFDVMVCFWCHDELGDVMTNFVTSWQTLWRYYVFFFILWYTLWHHDVFFTSCQTCRCNGEPFEVMMKLLTSWRTFWHHDDFIDIMTCLWHYDEFVMWQTIDVMTYVALIDVIMILTPGTFWNMTQFVDILKHFLTSWLTFSLHFCRSFSLFR